MINNAIERFRIDCENGGYVIYYKNKNGACYCYGVNPNKHGCMVYSPSRRTSKTAYETAKPLGKIF